MFQTSLQLDRLLSPTTAESFFREWWERQPLTVCGRAPDYYGDLFTWSDIDEVLAFSRPKFSHPDGFGVSTYIRGLPPDSPSAANGIPLGIAQVRQAYDQGKSIVVMAMQERRPAIAELCRGLELAFGCPVHANMYLTPRGSQGFAPHFDTHEVFVLQLEGSKQWRLFGATRKLPLVSDNEELRRRPDQPLQEVRLEPGDLLYIPRGHVHEAFASDCASLHLTIGVNVYRWIELLERAISLAARDDVRFRESLPRGALVAEDADVRERFGQLFDSLAARARSGELIASAMRALGDRFFSRLSMLPCGQFSADRDLEQLTLDSIVQRNPLAICRVVEDGLEAAIEFPGNRVAGPQRIAAALRFIAATQQFAIRELPGELNPQAKLVLVRRLCREGLLQLAAPPNPRIGPSGNHEAAPATAEDCGTPADHRTTRRKAVAGP